MFNADNRKIILKLNHYIFYILRSLEITNAKVLISFPMSENISLLNISNHYSHLQALLFFINKL